VEVLSPPLAFPLAFLINQKNKTNPASFTHPESDLVAVVLLILFHVQIAWSSS
jgi:hypothetical protein